MSRTIAAYDYDLATGKVSNKRQFAAIKGLGGVPDGATIDAEGNMWSCIAGGGKIVCFSPDGKIARTVEVPVPIITSVMFGGDNLDVMYATSIGEQDAGHGAGPRWRQSLRHQRIRREGQTGAALRRLSVDAKETS